MLTSEKLQWSSIDGKSWTASRHELKFEITLIEEEEFDVYQVMYGHLIIKDHQDYFQTIEEAKQFCEGIIS